MSKGLDIILEKIEANPDHATMVERFLQLSAELPDGMEKVEAILRLARALKTKYPDDALALVRQVYDQREAPWVPNAAAFEIKALHHLREVFIAMGHPAKGEVLALEIRKIEDGITSRRRAAGQMPARGKNDVTRASRVPEDPTAKPAMPQVPPRDPIPVPAVTAQKPVTVPPAEKPKAPPKPPGRVAKETTRTFIKKKAPPPAPQPVPDPLPVPEPPTRLIEQFQPQEDQDRTRIEDLQFKDIKKLLQFFDQYFKKPHEETGAARPMPTPERKVSPPPTPEEVSVRRDFQGERSLATIWRPLYDFLVGQSGKQSPKERLLYLHRALSWPVPEHRFLHTVERFRKGEMDVETERGREELAFCLWVDWGVEVTQRIMVAGRLEDSMLGLWSFTLDRMMAQGRHRMALALIRATLRDSLGDEWGAEAYARLLMIWPALEVDGFNWKEREGMKDLVARLKVRERPHLARILA